MTESASFRLSFQTFRVNISFATTLPVQIESVEIDRAMDAMILHTKKKEVQDKLLLQHSI